MPDDNVRAALETAMNAAESSKLPDTADVATETPAPVETAPEATQGATPEPEVSPGAERPRDASGKFAKPKDAIKPAPIGAPAAKPVPVGAPPAAAAPSAAASAAPPAPTAPALAPPKGWTPAAREQWGKLPAEVQADVHRRERETAILLTETAEARRLAEAARQTLAPYQQLLGPDPMRGLQPILHSVQQLANGSDDTKAAIVASLVKSYNINIEKLAQHIDNASAARAAATPDIQPQDIDQLIERRFQRLAQVNDARQAERIFNEFTANPPEFFDDVRNHMSALMAGGVAKDIQEAYETACWANPQVRGILTQRQEAQQAQAKLASTQRAREAASSVKGSPAGPPAAGGGPRDWREALEQAAGRSA